MEPANFFVIIKDADNLCIDCCENAPIFLDKPRDQVIGVHERDLLPPETYAHIRAQDNLARKRGHHHSNDWLFIRAEWHCFSTQRSSPDGQQIEVHATDITESSDPTGILQNIDHVNRTITFPLSGYMASEMELTILYLHLSGWRNKDIAKRVHRKPGSIDKQLSNMRQRSEDLYPGVTVVEALKAGQAYEILTARESWFMPVEQTKSKQLRPTSMKKRQVTEKVRKKMQKMLPSRDFPTDTSRLVR
jgi:hypothetical protein